MPTLNPSFANLGTETAYAVSAEARKYKAEGKKVYGYHIGDLNFRTPAPIVEACHKAIDEGKTGYVNPAGIPELVQLVAEEVSKERGVVYTTEEVVIQSGGKPVILKFLQSVIEPGDEVLAPTPGYPIYESLTNYLGGVFKPYTFIENHEKQCFELDLDYLKSLITPKTKAFIFNNYQNPTGWSCSQESMREIAQFCVDNDLWVLSDEAYFHLTFEEPMGHGNSIVSLPGMKERTVILLTASKSYAMTGWRLGAAIGPKVIMRMFERLTTNDEACTTNFIQWAGITALSSPEVKEWQQEMVKELRNRRDLIHSLVNQVPGFHAFLPPSTFYLYINATEAFKILKIDDYEVFRRHFLDAIGLSFCTRSHFGTPLPGETQKFIRFAFSNVTMDEIKEAMGELKAYMEKAVAANAQ